MTDDGESWLVMVTRLPTEPARHRMAVWRELRRAGAVPLGQGTWALPDVPAVALLVGRLDALAEAAAGTVLILRADGLREADRARLAQLYDEARQQEWAEFNADCEKYLAELDKEERIGKFTLAELEEEEQSLDRLRRWCRELRARDLSGNRAGTDGIASLKRCQERFDGYAEQVYAVLGGSA
ncbi:MAG TPA: Chromate resistance protein ChrB [Microlunatus sp.]|nr:Chromate resistance protein ChrB [Microlunatus sp.]